MKPRNVKTRRMFSIPYKVVQKANEVAFSSITPNNLLESRLQMPRFDIINLMGAFITRLPYSFSRKNKHIVIDWMDGREELFSENVVSSICISFMELSLAIKIFFCPKPLDCHS